MKPRLKSFILTGWSREPFDRPSNPGALGNGRWMTTAHYIQERLAGLLVEITRLAHGTSQEPDYLDDGSHEALKARGECNPADQACGRPRPPRARQSVLPPQSG